MPVTARQDPSAASALGPDRRILVLRSGEAGPADTPVRAERPFAPADRVLIDRFRALARRSRLAERLDLHEACALIASEPGDAAWRYGLALLSALGETARCRMVFHPAGSAETSFAERWLAALVASVMRDDDASVRFQVARLVAPEGRRAVRFLATGFAQALASEGKVGIVAASGAARGSAGHAP